MQSPPPQVHLVIPAVAPAPAQLFVAHRSAACRMARAGGALAAAAVAAALVAVAWPGSPWAGLVMAAGLPAAVRLWRGCRYVCSFMGLCPACGRALRLPLGTAAELPLRVCCRGCGARPELRIRPVKPSSPERTQALRHLRPDCTGAWRSEWLWDECTLACAGCGARQAGTAALRRAAAEENLHGDLMERLAEEGRFL